MKVMFWRVAVEMLEPPTQSKGGIVLAEQARQVDADTCNAGRIVDMGELAFTARTSLGYNYGAMKNVPKVGDLVLVTKHGGRDLSQKSGKRVKLFEDYEILAILNNEDEVSSYVR